MWKSPISILLLLLVLALSSGFWLYKSSLPSSPTLAKTEAALQAPPSLKQRKTETHSYSPEVKDVAAKMDENYTQAVKIFTPEVRELVSRVAKNQLEKKYEPLFLKWGLEAAKGKEVLDLIYERDEAIRNAGYKLNTNGRSGLREFQWAEFNEMHMVRFQLEFILGAERTDELCRMETERRFDSMAKATGLPKEELRRRMSTSSLSESKAPSPPSVFKRD